MPSARASVADNDLALGKIVEAVSHSKYWRDTVIFVVEDDAQDGLDHVDGRRSLAFAISAYTRRRITDSSFYNQNSVLRSIESIFHLPPLTLFDVYVNTMAPAFSVTADLAPYTAQPNRIPLDEMNPDLKSLQGASRKFAELSMAMDFSAPDRINEEQLNQVTGSQPMASSAAPTRMPSSRRLAAPPGSGNPGSIFPPNTSPLTKA